MELPGCSPGPWARSMAAKVSIGTRAPDAAELTALVLAFDRLERQLAGMIVAPGALLMQLTFGIGRTGAVSIEVPVWLYRRFEAEENTDACSGREAVQ